MGLSGRCLSKVVKDFAPTWSCYHLGRHIWGPQVALRWAFKIPLFLRCTFLVVLLKGT